MRYLRSNHGDMEHILGAELSLDCRASEVALPPVSLSAFGLCMPENDPRPMHPLPNPLFTEGELLVVLLRSICSAFVQLTLQLEFSVFQTSGSATSTTCELVRRSCDQIKKSRDLLQYEVPKVWHPRRPEDRGRQQ
jgi:hypothetical protein